MNSVNKAPSKDNVLMSAFLVFVLGISLVGGIDLAVSTTTATPTAQSAQVVASFSA